MEDTAAARSAAHPIAAHIEPRSRANLRFFQAESVRLAELCHRMAERFARGGRLLACGRTPAARSDVRHVAVEFVHPVIVGKRALPAIGLTGDGGPLDGQILPLVAPDDMLLAFGADGGDAAQRAGVERAVAAARSAGALTVAFGAAGADHVFDPPTADPFIRQELVETLYHVLWELVHVFFEHRGLLAGRGEEHRHDAGGSSFLYPFLAQAERDVDVVLEDVRRSIVMKAEEVGALRVATLRGSAGPLESAADALRERLGAGGTVFALGNGGSATDAMDLVADLRCPPGDWPSRAALDLTEDTSILTAVANDVGVESIFTRQIIAYGREADAVVAFSTSGGSRNVIHALREARRRGMATIAFVGYDGGEIASGGLADHIVLSPSQHIPRIQEAQASGYHILRTLIERTVETD